MINIVTLLVEIIILIPFNNGWRVKFNAAVIILTIEKAMLKAPNKTQNRVGSMSIKIKIAPSATIAMAATAVWTLLILVENFQVK